MKRALVKMVAVVVLTFLPLIAFAGKNDLNPGEIAAVKLMALQRQGVAQLVANRPGVILFIEHKVWKKLTSRERYNLSKIMLDYTKQLAKEEGKKYDTVMICDKAINGLNGILATIFVDENRIEITK